MSTTYYIRLKSDKKLNKIRNYLKKEEERINQILEKEAEKLYNKVTEMTEQIINEDNFTKQFCNSAGWYGGYPDEPEDYHLKKIWIEEIEPIRIEIGVYSGGSFHWHLMNVNNGYYELKSLGDRLWDYEELKVYEFPKNREQFIWFMQKYKDKVEIVDEYNNIFTLNKFLKEVGEQ